MPGKPNMIEAGYIYAICFDVVVFFLSVWKFIWTTHQRSQLVDLLFKDGLVYIVIVYGTHTFLSCITCILMLGVT